MASLSPPWKNLGFMNYIKVNYWIQCGCAGISTTVFVAWQYALRDGSSTLADPELLRGLDAQLPYRAWARVQTFLDDNFLLRPGDEYRTPWTLITSAFSHRATGHFLANLISFNSICNVLNLALPPVHLVGLILSTALGGSVGFLAQQSRSKFPNRRVRALGMSGITTGLGVATAVLMPWASASVYGFSVPIWVALGGYIAWDVFLLPHENSNIGHAAHIGGGIAGLVYALVLQMTGDTYLLHHISAKIFKLLDDAKLQRLLDVPGQLS